MLTLFSHLKVFLVWNYFADVECRGFGTTLKAQLLTWQIATHVINGINRNVRIYLAKCLMKISRLNGTAQIAAYIYIYIYIHTYITWRYKRDISLIPPCIHQLFLQTNTCAEVIKEHKKKG